MHKQRLNELSLRLSIEPNGPLLIKSGQESGADPTLPSMNFVRTQHPMERVKTIYLPGASLKGVIRSHSERIIRTVHGTANSRLCCDPLDSRDNCSSRIRQKNIKDTAEQYKELCLACRIFGHMVQASHFWIADAYPDQAIDTLPVRHNVAIDRLSGGVAVGPFDMEVAMEGKFTTTIRLQNFEVWQVGLLALALRDLNEGRVRIGFAKSRGLGEVHLILEELEVGYPAQFDPKAQPFTTHLLGASHLAPQLTIPYGYQREDLVEYPAELTLDDDSSAWGRPTVRVHGSEAINNILKAAVTAWANLDINQLHAEIVT